MKPGYCPTESYVCKADLVTDIELDNKDLTQSLLYDITRPSSRHEIEREGLKVLFYNSTVIDGLSNLTAQLFSLMFKNGMKVLPLVELQMIEMVKKCLFLSMVSLIFIKNNEPSEHP